MLTDPRHLHLPITDIAFAVGFGDVSHFNRMFHKRFGETPSGVRAASIMRAQGDPATPHNARATPLNAGIRGLREHPSAT
jgi:AraC-like DNA-binding protein